MVNRSVADILRAAKARIGTPERWCKGTEAAYEGWKLDGPTCAAFSLIDKRDAYDALCRAAGGACLPSWNDAPERTHAEVMAVFDRAIAAEEAS